MGQLTVLLQYKWPEHEQTSWHVVDILKQQEIFSHHEFFKYVILKFGYMCMYIDAQYVHVTDYFLLLHGCNTLPITTYTNHI